MRLFSGLILTFALSACSAPAYDISTLAGQEAILDAVNGDLDHQDCSDAIIKIEGLYNSPFSSNKVRFARASAHGCNAGINFFKLVGDLTQSNIVGSGLWISLAQLFPSSTTDSRAESAWYAIDALQSAVKPGTLVSIANKINATTNNPGSLSANDRVDDANTYMIFASMAAIGTLENRYGAPDVTTFHKGKLLGDVGGNSGWQVASNMDVNGCAYAGSVLNLFDSIGQMASQFPSNVSSKLNLLVSTFQTAMDLACQAGCYPASAAGVAFNLIVTSPIATGCAAVPAGACSGCPKSLLTRTSCVVHSTSDPNSCAAAGLVHFVNNAVVGNWP